MKPPARPQGPGAFDGGDDGAGGAGEPRRWKKPWLRRYGRLVDAIRGGGGKLSVSVDGDGRKPSGSG